MADENARPSNPPPSLKKQTINDRHGNLAPTMFIFCDFKLTLLPLPLTAK